MDPVTDERLDAVFAALADPTRRDIVARLGRGDATVTELAAPYAMSVQGVSQHIQVLERCGLVSRGRHRQTRPCRLEPDALQTVASWIEDSRRAWAERMDRLETHLARLQDGGGPVSDELVYRRVFRAPRELVWRCLTEPVELAQFWGPLGTSSPLDGIVVELFAGGRFETVMVGEHGTHRMVATYTEVLPPERIAWVEPASGMHTTSTLNDLGDGRTEVVIHSAARAGTDATARSPVPASSSLDELERHLTTLAGDRP